MSFVSGDWKVVYQCGGIPSLQVKQLRNRADEDARLVHMSLQMGSEPPSLLRKDLDHLMILVSLPCLQTMSPRECPREN